MIAWRMRLRSVKEVLGGIFSAFVEDPRGSLRFFLQLPILLFQSWVEHGGNGVHDPHLLKFFEEEEKKALRDFHEYVSQLPSHLSDFSRYFGKPKFSQKEVREIVAAPRAKEMFALCPTLEKLVPYDIFHTNFFTVIGDIAMDLESMIRHGQVGSDVRIAIGRTIKCVAVENGGPDASVENMIERFDWELGRQEIKLTRWNQGMWEWLFDLLLVRPYVIPGFEAQVDGENLLLVKSEHLPQLGPSLEDREKRDEVNRLRWTIERKTA